VIHAITTRATLWGAGFSALFSLARESFAAWRSGGTAALVPLLTSSAGQSRAFAVLRAFWPNLRLSRRFITAYDNTGTAIVTRETDVREVLEREADFAVVYEPRMRRITDGENFFLGMQDSALYQRDTSNMRLAARREDVAQIVLPFAREEAARIIAAADGTLDLPAALSNRVPVRLVARYFGLPYPDEDAAIRQATRMFHYLFADLSADAALGEAALADAAEARGWMDAAIAARKASGEAREDILGRCLAMQRAGLPGMSDLDIRNNLIGLFIGLVPTLNKAAVNATAQLLARPDALRGAQTAARAGDGARLAGFIWEALRFDPVNPMIYRRANRTTEIARGTRRRLVVPEGTMVLAANLSAMHDALAIEAPGEFRAGRPDHGYILWGTGMHTCFGAHINRAVLPAMLAPVLACEGLRAESAPDGQGTPFPAHFRLRWGAST
jgi:cytochrome P450